MKLALKAAAKLANINVTEAAKTVRQHPLLNEEIHVEEELINLQEAFSSNEITADTLANYPKMRRHIVAEQREILKHTIGLIHRMIDKKRLPRQYSEADVQFSLKKLIQLLVSETQRVNREIDEDIMDIIKPFMSWRQRMLYALPDSLSPLHGIFRRLARP